MRCPSPSGKAGSGADARAGIAVCVADARCLSPSGIVVCGADVRCPSPSAAVLWCGRALPSALVSTFDLVCALCKAARTAGTATSRPSAASAPTRASSSLPKSLLAATSKCSWRPSRQSGAAPPSAPPPAAPRQLTRSGRRRRLRLLTCSASATRAGSSWSRISLTAGGSACMCRTAETCPPPSAPAPLCLCCQLRQSCHRAHSSNDTCAVMAASSVASLGTEASLCTVPAQMCSCPCSRTGRQVRRLA